MKIRIYTFQISKKKNIMEFEITSLQWIKLQIMILLQLPANILVNKLHGSSLQYHVVVTSGLF